jgi:hypothetical protein
MTITETTPITPFQIKRIMTLCKSDKDEKEYWVKWATDDPNRTSLKSITHNEAIQIIQALQNGTVINQQTENRATFDKNNPKHKMILSLCRQANWTVTHEKHGEVADLNRLNNWLHSDKCPVPKPLMKMDPSEIQRIIKALTGIVKSIYK